MLSVETPHGPANVHLQAADGPRAALVLGHGAGGGVTSQDLVAATEVALAERISVALVEQPYRVAERRARARAPRLDADDPLTLLERPPRLGTARWWLGDKRWRELLEEHHGRIREQPARFRGVELDTAGDGFFARFDGPGRAIRCACALRERLAELGLEIRAGLHTGECELLDGKVAGIAVSIGAQVAAEGAPGQVLVSSTVKDLVAGSGIEFKDQGVYELKGLPGEWRLFAVQGN